MTNLSVSEKLALEEVFECLKDENCRKISAVNKRLFVYPSLRTPILHFILNSIIPPIMASK